MPAPAIFIIDNDAAVRSAIVSLTRSLSVGAEEFCSVEEFLGSFDETRPGCIVTDVWMTGMSGLDLQTTLLQRDVQIPIIVVSGYANTRLTSMMIKNGAFAFLDKPCHGGELLDAISKALHSDAARREIERGQHAQLAKLNRLDEDERAVLDLLMLGYPNKRVASLLSLSVRTIENRRASIFKKTETASLVELAMLALNVTTNAEQPKPAGRLGSPCHDAEFHSAAIQIPYPADERRQRTEKVPHDGQKRNA